MNAMLRRATLAGGGLIAAGGLLWLLGAAPAAAGDDISGVVRSTSGPEAGVWVIASTDDLETVFRKIVVTDNDGRFLVPDLPDARYQVWARGYGLVDSAALSARPGDSVELNPTAATSPRDAAAIYPGNYWYSLLEVPTTDEFPGTGESGNGIGREMRTQAQWVDRLKDGCQLCHQMGNLATREVPNLSDYDSTRHAWDQRVLIGSAGAGMNAGINRMGRDRSLGLFADWTDRIMAGEVPPAPPRPEGVERNVVLTQWGWSTDRGFIHDEIATDKRDPTLYANGAGLRCRHDGQARDHRPSRTSVVRPADSDARADGPPGHWVRRADRRTRSVAILGYRGGGAHGASQPAQSDDGRQGPRLDDVDDPAARERIVVPGFGSPIRHALPASARRATDVVLRHGEPDVRLDRYVL